MVALKPFAILSAALVLLAIIIAVVGLSTGVFKMAERTTTEVYGDITNSTVLTVNCKSGGVTVRTWEEGHALQEKIEVRAKFKTLWGEDTLDKAEVKVTTGSDFVIEVVFEDASYNSVAVDLTIHLPDGINVTRVKTSNGGVDLKGLSGDIDVDTSNGRVDVDNHQGNVDVTSDNGRIDLDNVNGTVKASTDNGKIDIDGARTVIIADTSNGAIHIDDVLTVKEAKSSNGEIIVHMDNVSETGSYFTTSNGKIKVYIPSETQAYLNMKTSNGDADAVGFLVLYERLDSNYKKGSINGGGPEIKLRSSNNDVSVRAEVV